MRSRSRGRAPRTLDARAARLAAVDLLARRAWTRAQLAERLARRGAPQDVAAEVVADLSTRGYLDDRAFARHWVETRAARGYGPTRLRAELRTRGVASDLIDAALDPLTRDTAIETARATARRRLLALARGAPERVAARLYAYLVRRGYSFAIATRVVRELADVMPRDHRR